MTAKTLKPWSDGNSYKNTVWDNQKNILTKSEEGSIRKTEP